jgi:hypothetical protein
LPGAQHLLETRSDKAAGRPHVLIVGATGVSGSRLVRLLARRLTYRLTLGGRNESRAVALAAEMRDIDSQGEFAFFYMDRDTITAARLAECRCDIVVDCTGRFDVDGTALVEAAIGARCHYLDLADSRAFVGGIARFDNVARAAGISVTSGATVVPALTHAVVEALTGAWLTIDSIDVAMLPGNRTPHGRLAVDAALRWVGKPADVFTEGQWQRRRGWSGSRRITADGLGRRDASLANFVDLDLLPRRFQPRFRATCDVGLELPLLHRLMALAGGLVNLKLLPSARWLALPARLVASWCRGFGTDTGGLVVDIAGQDARGEVRLVRWTLVAGQGDWAYLPVLSAAALIQAIATGHGPRAGAAPAAGQLRLDEIRPWFNGLAIDVRQAAARGEKPVLRRAMGAAFEALPSATRHVHRGRPALLVSGEAVVAGAANLAGRALARLLGLPGALGAVPLHVAVETRNGRELWARFFGDTVLRSEIRLVGEDLIEERIGGLRLRLVPVAAAEGIDYRVTAAWIGWVPVPVSKIVIGERVDASGRHVFLTEIAFPVVGRLASWRGVFAI